MSRTSLLLAAFSLAVGMTGCTHCDTCDDFPTPCTGPNCGFRGGPVGGTVEDYIAKSGELLTKSGFTERELARRVEIYGDLAHA